MIKPTHSTPQPLEPSDTRSTTPVMQSILPYGLRNGSYFNLDLFVPQFKDNTLTMKTKDMNDSETFVPKTLGNIETSLRAFGARHLDPELTQFCLTLWERMQASPNLNTGRGKPGVWAASLVHVIARMNFLYDKTQPIHLKLDTICDAFVASKKTVGAKATDIERKLGLGYVAAGLCRTELMKPFILLELTNGTVVTYLEAEKMGILPEGARPEDFC